jgi:branched-chain amino acid transport system ATP-binding protein
MSEPGLIVDKAKINRGELEVVHGVSLRVPPGKVTVLLGANGAGKTSLLDGIAGVIPLTGGSVSMDGAEIHRMRRDTRAKAGLAYVEQGRTIFPDLTVEENLNVAVQRGGSVEEAFELFPELTPRRGVESQMLSGGEQQMLVLARALVARPRVLLIDELSQGLAPVVVRRLMPYVARAAESGIAVLLVEQFAPLALGIGERAYVMNVGEVVIEEPAKELLAKPELLHAAYLTGHVPDSPAKRRNGNGPSVPAHA